MNDVTDLKKIILGFLLAFTLFIAGCASLSEEKSKAEVVTTAGVKPQKTPPNNENNERFEDRNSSKENDAVFINNEKQPLDLSLPYNSFKEEKGWGKQLWGRPFRNKLYLGMWTFHFESGDDQESTNNLIGGTYRGYYGGTLINTHRDRVWSVGWQRTLFQSSYKGVEVEAGYRAGIIYGYKRYLKLGDTRLFPLLQGLLDIEFPSFSRNVGVQLSWAFVVVSAGFYYRF